MHDRPKSLHTKCRLICSVTARTKRSFRSRVWLLWNHLTSIVKKLMASGTKAGSSSTPSFSTLSGATGSSSEFDQLIFRSGTTFGGGQLNELALKLAQLKDWKNKIAVIKELQQTAACGKLPLGLPPNEALRKVFITTNFGKAEKHYKEMHEESMVYLDNYRREKEVTERHYGKKETMEQVWTEVIQELKPEAWSADMYDETRLQTNIEIYEEIWNHEYTKAQAQVKQMQEQDLHPLRLHGRERVDALLSVRGGELHTPRSARGMMYQTTEQSWSVISLRPLME